MSDSLQPCGLKPTRLPCPWDSPDKNTGVGVPCPPPEDLPDPEVETVSLASPASAARFSTISATWEAPEASEGRVKIQSAGPQA